MLPHWPPAGCNGGWWVGVGGKPTAPSAGSERHAHPPEAGLLCRLPQRPACTTPQSDAGHSQLLLLSNVRSAHTPLQRVRPLGQPTVHVPVLHCWAAFVSQAIPQEPPAWGDERGGKRRALVRASIHLPVLTYCLGGLLVWSGPRAVPYLHVHTRTTAILHYSSIIIISLFYHYHTVAGVGKRVDAGTWGRRGKEASGQGGNEYRMSLMRSYLGLRMQLIHRLPGRAAHHCTQSGGRCTRECTRHSCKSSRRGTRWRTAWAQGNGRAGR